MEPKSPHMPDNRSRAYARPELRKYGHLAQITSTVGNKGTDDGGANKTDKTSV